MWSPLSTSPRLIQVRRAFPHCVKHSKLESSLFSVDDQKVLPRSNFIRNYRLSSPTMISLPGLWLYDIFAQNFGLFVIIHLLNSFVLNDDRTSGPHPKIPKMNKSGAKCLLYIWHREMRWLVAIVMRIAVPKLIEMIGGFKHCLWIKNSCIDTSLLKKALPFVENIEFYFAHNIPNSFEEPISNTKFEYVNLHFVFSDNGKNLREPSVQLYRSLNFKAKCLV